MELEFRFAMVAYKDFGDAEQKLTLPFTANTQELEQFLQRLTAGGGSDLPEDVLGALKCAADFDGWQSKVRFCVLIGDAPGHGRDLNDLGDDRFLNSISLCTMRDIGDQVPRWRSNWTDGKQCPGGSESEGDPLTLLQDNAQNRQDDQRIQETLQ